MNIETFVSKESKIGIVGLGYVGLPLASLFSTKFNVLGFDINEKRISELNSGHDRTGEVESSRLTDKSLTFSSEPSSLKECDVVIATVPTPIDEFNTPDLGPVRAASITMASNLKPGAIVVYESTVYPGVTEEECVPILEKISGKTWKKDFFVGYSPERVNPGDKNHTIDKIVKVVAGDTLETKQFLCELYGAVITAGVHPAANIKTAEAAKVIENTQRDLNIALMNELAIIFNKLDLDTSEVLEAAGTKWNFLKFYPGLVGGHCIGVDPYYLTFKAESLGYHPQVILSGRRINDRMGSYVAEQTIKKIAKSGKIIQGAKILITGFTFKENIPDVRNTRVIDIFNEIKEYGVEPVVFDPHVDEEEMLREYNISVEKDYLNKGPYLAVIIAVAHDEFKELFTLSKCRELQEGTSVIVDLKGIVSEDIPENVEYFKL